MRAGNGEGGTSMYRLSMAKGKRRKDMMHLKLELDLYLSREELAALHKAVEKHKAMQERFGRKPDWGEDKELVCGILRRVDELKERYEEERNAESDGNIDEALPVAGEVRRSKDCRQVV